MVMAKLANLELGDNQHRGSANSQTQPVSQSSAAEMLNVSTRTVAAAATVHDEAPSAVVAPGKNGAGSSPLDRITFGITLTVEKSQSEHPCGFPATV